MTAIVSTKLSMIEGVKEIIRLIFVRSDNHVYRIIHYIALNQTRRSHSANDNTSKLKSKQFGVIF